MMRLLIGYNGTDVSNAALDDLLQAGLPDQAEALVLSVAEICCAPVNLDEASKRVAGAADKIKTHFSNWSVKAETAAGVPSVEILRRAESFRPDLIVVGEHRQLLKDRNIFLGHASQNILTQATCSVRIARGNRGIPKHSGRLLVGFDGSPGAQLAIAAIASRSWPAGTEVRLLAVADSSVLGSIGRFIPQMADVTIGAKLASQWAETLAADSIKKLINAGLSASVETGMGYPKDTIIKVAEEWNADAIFVGPHCPGNSFERFLLGSVSAAVAARAHCSVEIIRSTP